MAPPGGDSNQVEEPARLLHIPDAKLRLLRLRRLRFGRGIPRNQVPVVDSNVEGGAQRIAEMLHRLGALEEQYDLSDKIRACQFEPHVYKRAKNSRRSKGVGIALARDTLSHAFRGNYEAVSLVAGDGDYSPIEEVKRLGKIVIVQFFACPRARAVKQDADRFLDLTERVQKLPAAERRSEMVGNSAKDAERWRRILDRHANAFDGTYTIPGEASLSLFELREKARAANAWYGDFVLIGPLVSSSRRANQQSEWIGVKSR